MKLQDMWRALQKFSYTEDSFSMMLENVAVLLRTLTININKSDVKSISWVYYVISIIGGLCYFYVYIFSMLWMVLFYYSIPENFAEISVVISLTACSITAFTKIIFMKLHLRSIQEIIEKFRKFDAKIMPGTKFAINLRKNLRVVKKRALFIWKFLLANCALYLTVPFIRPGRHFTEDFYVVYGFEPMVESPNYEIVNILTIIGILYGLHTMVNMIVFVVVIVGYNEAQLYTISEELRNLWDDSQNFYCKIKHQIHNKIHAKHFKQKIENEYIRIRLNTIVYYHVSNINLFKELNNQFNNILAIDYSIMCIAIIAEFLGGLENTYLQIPYTLVQIVMDCLSGQRLIDACHELENSLYSCKWEVFNVSNQKTILLMLMISQKTLMMSAGGMASLNFSCLMIILKSSYSAYTTLKSSFSINKKT